MSFFKPRTPENLAKDQLEWSKLELLDVLQKAEYYKAMSEMLATRIARLTPDNFPTLSSEPVKTWESAPATWHPLDDFQAILEAAKDAKDPK